jgi:hypothetical protein
MLNVASVGAYAATSADESFTGYEMDEAYVNELTDMGFSAQEIDELHEITMEIANADSSMAVSDLMTQYHNIVDGTPMAASTSIWTSLGGTLELDYTGTLNPFSNVIYTKVVYLPAEQVVYYQSALKDVGFLDWLEGEGISLVTTAAAAKICTYLGITSGGLSWLVGASIGLTFYILQNMEAMDLEAAVNDSTNGKVKLEYFYSTSMSFPYYMEYENFEAWNSSYVDVPDNYDYTWNAGTFDYD